MSYLAGRCNGIDGQTWHWLDVQETSSPRHWWMGYLDGLGDGEHNQILNEISSEGLDSDVYGLLPS